MIVGNNKFESAVFMPSPSWTINKNTDMNLLFSAISYHTAKPLPCS